MTRQEKSWLKALKRRRDFLEERTKTRGVRKEGDHDVHEKHALSWAITIIENNSTRQEVIKEVEELLVEVDEVDVSKSTNRPEEVMRFEKIGISEEAKFGWNEAMKYLKTQLKEKI